MPRGPEQAASSELQLAISAVDESRWLELQQLFEGRGGPHYCWCMAWRKMPSKPCGDAAAKKAAKKAEMKGRIQSGTPVGILGYVEGQPVAWCSVGPRSSFRRLAEKDYCAPDENVWSIVCFFIHRKFRGLDFTRRLIEAAVAYARQNGADVIEAYPVDKSSPSYRFMGLLRQFERAGFVNVGKTGKWRHVVQLRET